MTRKSNFKRFCSFFVAIAILCGTFVLNPQPVMAASDVYVGGAGALDTNNGLTSSTPVATLEVALDKIAPNTTGTIHVQSNIDANVFQTVPPYDLIPATVPTSITNLTIQSDGGNYKINGSIDISGPLELTLKDVWLFSPVTGIPLTTPFPAINIAASAPTTINMDSSIVEAAWVHQPGSIPLMPGIRTASPLKVIGEGLIQGGGAGTGAGIAASADVDISGPAAPDTLKIYGGNGNDNISPNNDGSDGILMSNGADVKLKGKLDIKGGAPSNGVGSSAVFCGPGSDMVITDPTSYITVKGGSGGILGAPGIESQGQIIFQDIPAEFYVEGGSSTWIPINQTAAIKILGGNANIIYNPASFGDNVVTDGHLEYKTRPVGSYGEGDPTYTLVNSQFTGTPPSATNVVVVGGVTNVSLTVPPHIATNASFTGDIQYQWEKSTDGGATWAVINPDTDTDGAGADTDTDGQDTATLPTFIPTVSNAGEQYRCGVGNHIYTPTWTLRVQETMPNVQIDYETEELINFAPGDHTINTSVPIVPDSSGKTPINDATTNWITTTISIVKDGNGTTTTDSNAQSLYLSPRPPAPTTVVATNETIAGNSDGTMVGITSVMEWRPTGGSWTQGTGSTITGLTPGNYEVRIKASNPNANFYGETALVTIGVGNAPTYTLVVTAPIFAPEIEGYTTQPAAQPIIITSTGNSMATISSVTVSDNNGVSAFTIGGSGTTVASGNSINTRTVQPSTGLVPGTYTETITVTYDSGATATATVTFTVRATYIVTAVSNPVAGGTTTVATSGSPSSSVTDLPGTTVTMNAVPATGYTFSHWVVSDPSVILANSATTASNSFIMPNTDVTVTAYYSEIPNPVTVNVSPVNAGNATLTVGGVTGTTATTVSNVPVSINATPNYGFQFDHWDLNGSPVTLNNAATVASNSFNMPDANVTLTAVFLPATIYNITLTTNIPNAGIPVASISSNVVTTAIVTDAIDIDAAPAVGYDFIGWAVTSPTNLSVANAGTPITSFAMPASNVAITANYALHVIDTDDDEDENTPDPTTTTTTTTTTPAPTAPTPMPSTEPLPEPSEIAGEVSGEEMPLGTTSELAELNPISEIFMKMPNKVEVIHGEYVDYTLSGIGNPYSTAVQDYAIGDNPPEGLAFVEGHIPAFTNGEGLTYSILYKTNYQDVRTMYEDLDATQKFAFKAPSLEEGEYITGIYVLFDEVPVDFAYGDTITYTFQVTETESGTVLTNEGFVSFKLHDLQMSIPNEGNSDITVYGGSVNKVNPKTGDSTDSYLLFAAASFVGILALAITNKRKKRG